MHNKVKELAKILVEYSVEVKKEDNVVIDVSDFSSADLARECFELCLQKDANPYLNVMGTNLEVSRADYGGFVDSFFKYANGRQLSKKPEIMEKIIDWGDKFIRITSIHNKNFLSSYDSKKIALRQKTVKPIFSEMIKKDWILTYYPTIGMAQNAVMSLEQFTEFYFEACTMDLQEMKKQAKKIQNILDKGEKIKVEGEGIDLELSIKNRLASKAEELGKRNIPDGEVFIAPNEYEVEGNVQFEWPQNYMGKTVSNLKIFFEKGTITKFEADSGYEFFKALLEEDEGNKRLKEFAIGINKKINKYIQDILFDEKMSGTIHMALGSAYEQKHGGGTNKASIHWDLIKKMNYSNSTLKVDETHIIKNGKMVV